MKEKDKEGQNSAKFLLDELSRSLNVVSESFSLLKDQCKGLHDVKKEQLFGYVETNLERAVAVLNGVLECFVQKQSHPPSVYFDMLEHVQHVCSTHDQLFLQKQLRYRVTASADLPKVYASPDKIFMVLSHLISNAIKYAPRASDIEIKLKEVTLRQGAGVEVNVINDCEGFSERDRYQIFEKFYSSKGEKQSRTEGIGLAVCRDIVQKAFGQLWVDIPSKGKVSFAFVLPCVEVKLPLDSKGAQTYKYDITVVNYKELKEKFGSEKSSALLSKIEEEVRHLIRHPIDVVTAFEGNGIISVIYETGEEHAGSVSTRISHRLGNESYRIGKSSIDVMFKYHLSILQ